MANVNRGSPGCRAVVMAGTYLSGPAAPAAVSRCRQQRRMVGPWRRLVSSNAAGRGGKTAAAVAAHAPESPVYVSAAERHIPANWNLIYRDVKAFLNEVGGDPREARYWLTRFQSATGDSAFAVIEVRPPATSLSGVRNFHLCLSLTYLLCKFSSG